MTSESGNSTYFDQAYRDYQAQNPPRKLDHYLDEIQSRVAPGVSNLLDVGCGLGSFLERAAYRFPDWRLYGTDVEPSAVSTTCRLIPSATITLASAIDTPYPDGSFDIITAWDVIEHVPDRDRAASSISRMLKPQGLFFLVVPVFDGLAGFFIRRLDKDSTHTHKQSRDAWLEWAKDSFEILEWHGLARYLIRASYLHFPTSLLRRQTPAIMVVCRRL